MTFWDTHRYSGLLSCCRHLLQQTNLFVLADARGASICTDARASASNKQTCWNKFRCIFADLSRLAPLPPRPISLSPLALSLSASSTETNNPAVNLLSEHNHLITIFLNRWRSSRGISEQFLNGGPRRGGRATIPIPLWRSSCVHMTQNY